MTIAELVWQCFEAFEHAKAAFDSDELLDELGRFRIWVGNVSAHTTGKRSLQYRLRESTYLKTAVAGYLTDLLDAIHGQEVQHGHIAVAQEDVSDSDEDDAALFGATGAAPTTFKRESIDEINNIITCLMRVSTALRNPAKDDQVRYALDGNVKHFEHHDIEHVRAKFPHAAAHVIQTLGAALSRHRLYFKYREDHHEKLAEGVDGAVEERPSTIATSLARGKKLRDSADILTETDSMYTATSFATTKSGESYLRLPPLPAAGTDRLPFECPLCFHIIEMPDERSWRRHVYEDLPPYVCLAINCRLRGRQFSCRRDWQRHLKEHRQYWICPFDCSDTFQEPGPFKRHLQVRHLEFGGEAAMDRLLDYSVRVAESECVPCPLCLEKQPDAKASLKHLGHHMQQLALFAVPSRVYGEADGIESAREDGGASVEINTPTGSLPRDPEEQDTASQHLELSSHDEASVHSNRSFGSLSSSVSEERSKNTDTQSPTGDHSGMSTPEAEIEPDVDIPEILDHDTRSVLEATMRNSGKDSPQLYSNDTSALAESSAQSSKHDSVLLEKPQDELFECAWPGSSHKSTSMYEIRKHFEAQHHPHEAQPHGCPHCEKRFAWPKDVRRHLKQKHKDLAQPAIEPPRLVEDDFLQPEQNELSPTAPEEERESVDLAKTAESAQLISADAKLASHNAAFQMTPDAEPLNTPFAPGVKSINRLLTPDGDAGDSLSTGVSQSAGDNSYSSMGATTQSLESSSNVDPVVSRRLNWGVVGDFVCHFCSAGFSTQGDLTFHLRSHQPYLSRQHVCQHCEKRFQFRKDLMRHLPKHDPNRKRYYCTFTDCRYHTRGFGRQDHLDRHSRSFHRVGAPEQQTPRPDATKASLPGFGELAELVEVASTANK